MITIMTTSDENHIIKTSPARMLKGIIIVIVTMGVLGYITIAYWHTSGSIPPPVSYPKTPVSTAATTGAPAVPNSLSILAGASTQGNPAFAPDPLTVTKGAVVTVTNHDTVPHTVTSGKGPDDSQSGKAWDTSLIMPGKTAQIDTSKLAPGEYPFYCTVHPFMHGTLKVQ